MYAFIQGKIAALGNEFIVLENNGIGYYLKTSDKLIPGFGSEGEDCKAYTSMVVRENEISLYAFPTRSGAVLFELLQTVSGVGPKLASAILGTFTPEDFALKVLASDTKALTQVKGLGKKGAERLVLELCDKIKNFSPAEGMDSARENEKISEEPSYTEGQRQVLDDLISALLVLGFQKNEALKMAERSFDPELDLEENLRNALKKG